MTVDKPAYDLLHSDDIPLIFRRFPELRGKINWVKLGMFPTRVHKLARLGHDNLWIKREDESSPLYGGNKVRKLEFTLADAIARKKKLVITMGGIGTNHGLATAIFCRHLGLSCRLLLFNQPVTSYVKKNMLLFHKNRAELAYFRTILRTGIMYHTIERAMHPGAYFLYAGGSSPLGTIGVINAVFELKKQIDEGVMPSPRYIICPLGSNGTTAGLMLGAALAGLDAEVIGVRVSVDSIGPLSIANTGSVSALMKQTYRLLCSLSRDIPRITLPAPRILHQYFGTGYGCPTAECHEALEIVRDRENITLDPTYTAKTFAAVRDFIKEPAHRNDVVLYWHTYNSVDLSEQARSVDYHDLPREFHWVFENPEVSI